MGRLPSTLAPPVPHSHPQQPPLLLQCEGQRSLLPSATELWTLLSFAEQVFMEGLLFARHGDTARTSEPRGKKDSLSR